MKYTTCLAVFVLLLSGCSDNAVKFVVTNQSDTTLKTVQVDNGFNHFTIPSLPPGATRVTHLSFEGVPEKDGAYGLVIDNGKDSLSYTSLGYYTNGAPAERGITLVIYNDTVDVKFDHKQY